MQRSMAEGETNKFSHCGGICFSKGEDKKLFAIKSGKNWMFFSFGNTHLHIVFHFLIFTHFQPLDFHM